MSDDWTTGTEASVRPQDHVDPGLPLLAMAAGLVAALIGGAAWAAIGIYGGMEIGWAAWGIGVLVGGAMALTTPERSRRLALIAASLALVGLLAGKAMNFAGSVGPVAEEMLADADYMRGMTAWRMYAEGEHAPELQTAVEATEARGDTLSDAHWAAMLDAAARRLSSLTDDELRGLAREAASGAIRQVGLVEGVKGQLSGWDLLWLALAIATAWRIMDLPKPEPVVAGAEAEEAAEDAEKELV